jgi:hypothetical protein
VGEETTNRYFDELASGLASGSISRGRALRLMGAALVGGTLASLGIGEAAADDECKPVNKKCRKNHQCCSLNCEGGKCAAAACTSDGGTCSTGGTPCCSGNCSNGFCCPTGYVGLSNGTCAKPCTKGGDDCPGCAALCAEDVDGVSGCSSGFVRCSGNTDCLSGMCDPTSGICRCTDHTGCPSGQFCVGGTCQIAC